MELKKKKLDYNPYEDDEFDEYGNVSEQQQQQILLSSSFMYVVSA